MRKIVALILLACTILFTSCAQNDYSYCELSLPLASDYYVNEPTEVYDAVFTNGEAAVAIVRISFSAAYADGIPDTYSPRAFAEFYKLNNGQADIELSLEGDVPYYTYTLADGDAEYFLMQSFYRSKYAYLIVSYMCPNAAKSEYFSDFLTYASGAYFTE
ncbi:MAG: hypothetical protein IJY65_05120 [Clostridia bacterium]|nr:hypothetical protein [Clostridia bacterium]